MYRRALLSLYGAGISGGRLTGHRYADLVCRRLSVGRVLWAEKSPPENNGTGKPSGEAEDKSSLPPQPPKQDTLASLLSGMKVEVSSKKKFQAMKKAKAKQHSQENTDNIESASRMFQMVAEESSPDEQQPVSKELADAASAVASSYPSQQKQVESELLRQLRLHKQMAEEIRRKGSDNISNVISGMKVTKQRPKTGKQISAEEREFMRDASKKSLHTGKRLKIFPVPSEAPSEEAVGTEMPPTLWDLELAKEIASVSEHPPRNGFEEMIQWTKEGKLWTFPIDNETGLDEEQKVEFHEHIFLEKYLEDFPRHGPIRHFMELVICGLSKNPYLTVQQKKDHIDWFQDYFNKKEDLLRECDVYVN
ncbi:28S ribosomal protein S31, mitochondrial [Bufo bufo]|uniref:28S ribosomal protein S31, mitochondrial n=1 Tax=Bufo bufo TaxID=8384 RepID=UPI001ABE2FFF|nr:28S ribosomal protein S31, mitochondrial [Bufo bufo]